MVPLPSNVRLRRGIFRKKKRRRELRCLDALRRSALLDLGFGVATDRLAAEAPDYYTFSAGRLLNLFFEVSDVLPLFFSTALISNLAGQLNDEEKQ